MDRKEIGVISKDNDTEIRVALQEFLGEVVVDIRIWKKPKKSEGFYPTHKGVTIPLAVADEVAKAVLTARDGL